MSQPLFSLNDHRVHGDANVSLEGDLVVTTTGVPWAYAVSFPPQAADRAGQWLVSVDVAVEAGTVGIGILRSDGGSFIREALVSAPTTVNLRVPSGEDAGSIVIRDGGGSGAAQVRVRDIKCRREAGSAQPYLVDVVARNVASEPRPADGGLIVFDDPGAEAINAARIAWISRLDIDPRGKTLLDAGAGVGHFSRYYADRGAAVVAVEGRADNVTMLQARHPDVRAYVADVQTDDLLRFGTFDIVHCFGLLYHLDSPVTALRRLAAVCRGVLLIETIVCDSRKAVMLLEDEPSTVNQALAGLGCRPSPTFVAMALNRVGFAHVYGTTDPPRHPDFEFDWRDNGDTTRDGHNLRCVFVASREPLTDSQLLPLL